MVMDHPAGRLGAVGVARSVDLAQGEGVTDADIAGAMERLYPRLYRFARFSLEPEPAREAVAAAVERIWARRGRFEPLRGSLDGWLFTVGTNAIRDECRRRRRRGGTINIDDLQIAADDDLELRIRMADLRTALASMDSRARDLVAMRYALDLPIAEIAALTGKSPNATSVALHRALAALRRMMDGENRNA